MAGEHSRKGGRWPLWAAPAVAGLIVGAALIPLDGWIYSRARGIDGHIWGDAARVLDWLQEYGQGAAAILVGVLIWQLDPPRRRALLNGVLIAAIAAVVCFGVKMLVGRPRPSAGDHLDFVGPWHTWPVGPEGTRLHAWEVWRSHHWELWSMPSSHTAYAAGMSVFLATLYPPLRGMAITLALLVAACRVLNGAHYASDVVVGAGIGVSAGRVGMMGWKR